METCCRECDKTSLDINLRGLGDLGHNGVFLLDVWRIKHTEAAEEGGCVPTEHSEEPWVTCTLLSRRACDQQECVSVSGHTRQEGVHLEALWD